MQYSEKFKNTIKMGVVKMNYKIPNHILDIIMPLSKSSGISPTKLIEQAILNQYKQGDNVCLSKKKH